MMSQNQFVKVVIEINFLFYRLQFCSLAHDLFTYYWGNLLLCRCLKKVKIATWYFFSKCNQIHSFLHICSHLLKKFLMENLIFCGVHSQKWTGFRDKWNQRLWWNNTKEPPFVYLTTLTVHLNIILGLRTDF